MPIKNTSISSRLKSFYNNSKIRLFSSNKTGKNGKKRRILLPALITILALQLGSLAVGEISERYPMPWDKDAATQSMSQEEAAQRIEGFSIKDIKNLDIAQAYWLAKNITGDDNEEKLRGKIYRNMSFDKAYLDYTKPRAEKFYNWLKTTPEISKMAKEWANMPDDKRLENLKFLQNHYASLFGETAPPTMVLDIPPIDVKIDNKLIDIDLYFAPGGAYLRDYGLIWINKSGDDFDWNNFPQMAEVVIHETTHHLQSRLRSQLMFGQLDPKDPRYGMARIFRNNARHYVADSDLTYMMQPLEREAFKRGETAHKIIQKRLTEEKLKNQP